MKKVTLALAAVAALASSAFAGTETYASSKNMVQTPCPTWYADSEWNIGVSGIYAPTMENWEEDRYLGVDHAWGGAVDIKYFFHRYFGIGAQGFGLFLNSHDFNGFGFDDDDSNDFAGGLVGTFTFRYPIPCTRFAPYGWVGIGGIWGGGDTFHVNNAGFVVHNDDDGKLMGQYGVGFETRFTPHFGWTNDVSFNQVDGHKNDFWQFRTGLNFAF